MRVRNVQIVFGWEGQGGQECVAACVPAYQCPLQGFLLCLCSCFSSQNILIWTRSGGIIDTGATCGHVKRKPSTAVLPDKKW